MLWLSVAGGAARAALATTTLLATVVLAGCGGRPTAVETPRIVSASAERLTSAFGAALVATELRVQLDRPLRTLDSSVPIASYFELVLPRSDGSTKTVLVEQAEADEERPDVVRLRVGYVLPEGTVVRLAERAFVQGATGWVEAPVEGGLPLLQAELANGPLRFSDPRVVEVARVPEVTPEDRDPEAMREALARHLERRGAPTPLREAALATYDAIPAEIVPAPKARAALAALVGTFAEPAVASILSGAHCEGAPVARVEFAPPPDFPNLLARVTRDEESGRRILWLNPSLEGERFELLMPLLAHEAVHCDQLDGRFEELAATAFDTFLYLQLVAVDPSLPLEGTPLARTLNTDALALINSGTWLPESVGVLRSPRVDRVLPESNAEASSFLEHVAAAYPTIDFDFSPTEPLAQSYADRIAELTGQAQGDPFEPVYLDRLLALAMDSGTMLRVIAALRLEPAD